MSAKDDEVTSLKDFFSEVISFSKAYVSFTDPKDYFSVEISFSRAEVSFTVPPCFLKKDLSFSCKSSFSPTLNM